MASQLHLDPEWTITGGRGANGKVQLIASREIDPQRSTVSMHYSEEYDEFAFEPLIRYRGRPKITVAIGVRHFVLIEADTYEAALKHLFKTWSPDAPDGGEPRAIEGWPYEPGDRP